MRHSFNFTIIFIFCITLFSSCKKEPWEPIEGALRIVQWRVLITGDMVHFSDNDEHINKFLQIIASVKAPIMMTPGNHDIIMAPGQGLYRPVTLEGLRRYRSFFGDDFQAMDCKGFTIISANSTLWYPEGSPPEEIDRHDQRLNKALKDAQAKNQPIVMMTHFPPLFELLPFTEKYLNLCVESGAFVWLTGHWHCAYRHDYDSITILVGETTSSNNVEPLGIRLLTIYPDKSFDWNFKPLY
ncbi:MAG: metallophosphoesterase [Bacteroidetes bacterium]|nr:metallophosphoesterase [Bacteroidota bacterium]MCL2302523.1 metallophosphoesterase [Lentimicrobiaceae bacterium]